MQIRVVFYAIATVLIVISSVVGAQPAKTAKNKRVEYAYLDPQVESHFVKATSVPNGIDREYVAEIRVCYAQRDGCHSESMRESVLVREPLNRPNPIGPSNDPVWAEAVSKLTGRVVSQLGEQGWDFIGDAVSPTLFAGPSARVVWFKRMQTP